MKVNMPLARSEINKHIVTIRRIAEHREYEAEKKMLEAFTACYLDIQGFLGTEYAKYAQDDRLTLEILQQKGEYARFMDEFINRYDGATEHCYKIIDKLVNDTYKLCYQGMVDGVNKSKTVKDLHEQFKAVRAVTPETVKRAVQNPIPKLRLSPLLERSRKKVIDSIKREVTMGLTQGDRMSTMARRITHTVKTGYTQSMLIARTEAHRVREAGFNDASNRIDDILKNNNAEYRMVKIWKTMNDGAVRHTNLANHRDMHNQVVLQDEKFTLVGGAETDAPGQSGIAAEDCNCRCYVSRDLMNDAEFYAATGRHFTDPKDKKPDEPKAEPTKEPETVDNDKENDIIEDERALKTQLNKLEREKQNWLIANGYDIYDDMEKGFWEEASDGSLPDESKLIKSLNDRIDKLYHKLGYRRMIADDSSSYFKLIKGVHTSLDDLRNTNPKYSTNNWRYTRNCQRCVSTYEARRRGFDVIARPKAGKNDRMGIMTDKVNGWTSVYKNPVLISCNKPTEFEAQAEVIRHLTGWGDGARAIVRVQWKNARSGHVFIGENVGGKIRFIDPQSNNPDVLHYFQSAKSSSVHVMRIDNLEFADNIKKCCQNR